MTLSQLYRRRMSEILQRMRKRARELARSGKFAGWQPVVFELRFEPELKEAFQWLHDASVEDAFLWLHSPATKQELDRLCYEARSPSAAEPPSRHTLQRVRAHETGSSTASPGSSRTERR
jgi:hypothetical protein